MNERRNELQTNELASYLYKINKSIEPYSKAIAVVVGLVIVAAIGFGLYRSKVSGDRSDATLQLLQAVDSHDAERLSTVSATYPGTSAASWARLYEGNAHLLNGLRAMYLDRDEAEERLGDAKTAFEAALTDGDDRLLNSRAYFGLARVAETLGNIDEAIAAYRNCAAANESEAMVQKADERIEALSSSNTKEFLAWFSEQDFRPADPSLPPSLPGAKTLPDLPDLDLPPLDGGSDQEGKKDEDKMELKDTGLELPDDADVNRKADAKETTSVPSTDEAKSSDPKADEPKADEPKADEPKADEPKADEPKADEPKADEPKADEPKADEPKADEPKADEPKADEPKADAGDK